MGRAKSVTLPTQTMKTLGVASSYSKHKFGLKKHKICSEEDRISKLPDELLVSILSLLTITEAARTSVLSHRWESLWISYHGSLDFDLSKRLYELNVKEKLWPQERSKYLNWMNQVLRHLLLLGSSITLLDAFTVRFDDWDKYPKCLIDRLVEFVMTKRIQRLEFDMNPVELGTVGLDPYTFPIDFFAWIKQPCGLYRISALTSLTLKHINVTGDFIEYFLSNCPLLERLCVACSEELSNLKVTGAAALKLKYLEIECYCMESLEISAPNLLSLYYSGRRVKLHVENVPKLVEVSIGRDVITYMSGSLSSYLSQLQTLRLEFAIHEIKKFTKVMVLNNLKHLILRVCILHDESLLGWTSLIEASPFLQKFTLEAMLSKPDYRKKVRKVQKVTTKLPHQCLKVVELVGFTGGATELELAMYFIENSSSIEQIIIDRRRPPLTGSPFDFDEVPSKAQEKRGLLLKRYLPPGVDLVIV